MELLYAFVVDNIGQIFRCLHNHFLVIFSKVFSIKQQQNFLLLHDIHNLEYHFFILLDIAIHQAPYSSI